MMKYMVIIEKGPNSWGAYVPDLPGCAAAGESRDEVVRLIGRSWSFIWRGSRRKAPIDLEMIAHLW